MTGARSEYELFGAGLVRYLGRNLPLARELLCLTDCEPLGLSELAALCPELEEAIKCDRGEYLDGSPLERVRTRIAATYTRLTPAHVRLTHGAGYALLRVMQALLQPGDRVVVHVPAFPPLYTIPRALGCEVVRWTADAERGWALDLDFLADHLDDRTRLVVVSFPHNPTGYLPTPEIWRELVELAQRRGVHLLCDEVYRPAAPGLPAVADVYERGVSVGGLSKVFGLPALRVGWVATHDPALLGSAALVQAETAVASNLLGQVVADGALANAAAIVARSRAIVDANAALLRTFLGRHADRIRCEGPLAGPVVFARLLDPRDGATALCERLLREHATLAVPGPVLDADDRHLRVGLGRRRFPVALARLSDLLVQAAPVAALGPARG